MTEHIIDLGNKIKSVNNVNNVKKLTALSTGLNYKPKKGWA